MSDTVVQTLHDSGVLHLVLNRPHKKNAFNNEQWIAFREALREADKDPRVACLLISGSGSDFSSGVDLSSFSEEFEGEHPFDSAAAALVDFNKPVVAAAKGIAVGGGATLLLQCDVVLVGESLRLRFPFVNLGLVPEWGSSYALQAILGARKAAELMYTADWVTAEKAVSLGLASDRLDDAELLTIAMQRAETIAQWPISSLVATKRLMRDVHRDATHAAMKRESAGMAELAGSAENIEAITAIFEKRPADFSQFRR